MLSCYNISVGSIYHVMKRTYFAICAHDSFDVAGVFCTFAGAGAAGGAVDVTEPLSLAVSPPQVAGVAVAHGDADSEGAGLSTAGALVPCGLAAAASGAVGAAVPSATAVSPLTLGAASTGLPAGFA